MLLAAKSFVQTSGGWSVVSSAWVPVDARWAAPPVITRLHLSLADPDALRYWFTVLAAELAPRVLHDAEDNSRWPRNLTVGYRCAEVEGWVTSLCAGSAVLGSLPHTR